MLWLSLSQDSVMWLFKLLWQDLFILFSAWLLYPLCQGEWLERCAGRMFTIWLAGKALFRCIIIFRSDCEAQASFTFFLNATNNVILDMMKLKSCQAPQGVVDGLWMLCWASYLTHLLLWLLLGLWIPLYFLEYIRDFILQHSIFTLCWLTSSVFFCLISFLTFPCASVWDNTRVWVPLFS